MKNTKKPFGFASNKLKHSIIYLSAFCFGILSLSACSEDDDEIVSSVISSGATPQASPLYNVPLALLQSKTVPQSTSSDVLTCTASNQVLRGATNFVTIEEVNTYEKFYITVSGQEGYFEIDACQVENNKSIIPVQYFTRLSGTVTTSIRGKKKDSGLVTQPAEITVELLPYLPEGFQNDANNDLTIVLTFNNDRDLDLALTRPSESEINYKNPGGYYTVDEKNIAYGLIRNSNVGGKIDGLNTEYIIIPYDKVKTGEYSVKVNLRNLNNVFTETEYTVSAYYKGALLELDETHANKLLDKPSSLIDGVNPFVGKFASQPAANKPLTVMWFNIGNRDKAKMPALFSHEELTPFPSTIVE